MKKLWDMREESTHSSRGYYSSLERIAGLSPSGEGKAQRAEERKRLNQYLREHGREDEILQLDDMSKRPPSR